MPVSEVATWVSIAVNAIVGGFVLWYTLETQKYRKTSEATLAQLHAEHASRYDVHVTPVRWNRLSAVGLNFVTGVNVELINLGPGAAERVMVEAFCQVDSHEIHYFIGEIQGLVAGDREAIELEERQPEASFPTDVGDGMALLRVAAATVLGRQMPAVTRRFRYPPPQRQIF